MLRDRRPADRQFGGQFADRSRAVSQRLEDRPPRGVTQRGEDILSVSSHEL
jgi:hypothetical protein